MFYAVYAKPPMYDEALGQLVAKILSYAAVLHLAIGCWAYSASFVATAEYGAELLSTFGVELTNQTDVDQWIAEWDDSIDNGPVAQRLFGRVNVLPVLMLLFLSSLLVFYRLFWGHVEECAHTLCKKRKTVLETQARYKHKIKRLCRYLWLSNDWVPSPQPTTRTRSRFPTGPAAGALGAGREENPPPELGQLEARPGGEGGLGAEEPERAEVKFHPIYSESLNVIRAFGLETYDIRRHPLYAGAFEGDAVTSPRNNLTLRDPAALLAAKVCRRPALNLDCARWLVTIRFLVTEVLLRGGQAADRKQKNAARVAAAVAAGEKRKQQPSHHGGSGEARP